MSLKGRKEEIKDMFNYGPIDWEKTDLSWILGVTNPRERILLVEILQSSGLGGVSKGWASLVGDFVHMKGTEERMNRRPFITFGYEVPKDLKGEVDFDVTIDEVGCIDIRFIKDNEYNFFIKRQIERDLGYLIENATKDIEKWYIATMVGKVHNRVITLKFQIVVKVDVPIHKCFILE